jgi:hypothetical protein
MPVNLDPATLATARDLVSPVHPTWDAALAHATALDLTVSQVSWGGWVADTQPGDGGRLAWLHALPGGWAWAPNAWTALQLDQQTTAH